MQLTETTRELLRKELPWLTELLHPDVNEFYVQVIDLNVLRLQPWGSYIGSDHHWFVPFSSIHKLMLIDDKGNVIGFVGSWVEHYYGVRLSLRWPFVSRGLPKTRDHDFEETVAEGLQRIPGSEKTRYILHVAKWTATLHRLPKRWKGTLEEYLTEKTEQEMVDIKELVD
jgi:hypothetical protein